MQIMSHRWSLSSPLFSVSARSLSPRQQHRPTVTATHLCKQQKAVCLFEARSLLCAQTQG